MADTDPQREKNQLDILRELMDEQPDLPSLKFTTAQIEALLQRDDWSMNHYVPLSAWNLNNPSLRIEHRTYPAASNTWRGKLEEHRTQIERVIPYVGRLETTRCGREKVEGTGWLVREDVVVTNRHVANAIGPSLADATARLRIDFVEENGRNRDAAVNTPERQQEFRVLEVLYTAEELVLDLAFLRIAPGAGAKRAVIELGEDPCVGMDVCTIGYPTLRDTIYSPAHFFLMFGAILGVKRLSPGKVLAVEPARTTHDCATVGGSSGSVILDMTSGKAVAINYAEKGRVNVGVPASIVRERLALIH